MKNILSTLKHLVYFFVTDMTEKARVFALDMLFLVWANVGVEGQSTRLTQKQYFVIFYVPVPEAATGL
jgi:hypothetical protein